MTRKGKAAAAFAAAFAFALAMAGCSAESWEGFFETAAEVAAAMRPTVAMQASDAYYEYRYDFHHSNWAGDPWFDLGSAGFSLQEILAAGLMAVPEYSVDGKGRPETAMAYSGGSMADMDAGGTLPDPPGWSVSRYDGMAQDGLLYRRCMLVPDFLGGDYDAGNLFTGTSFLYYGGYAEAMGRISDWLERHLDGPGLLYAARLFYDNTDSLVPEGILIRAYALDGSFELAMYAPNLQPGVGIEYATGRNWMEKAGDPEAAAKADSEDNGGDAESGDDDG